MTRNLRKLNREQARMTPQDQGTPATAPWPCCTCCSVWKPATCPLKPHDAPCPACTDEE